MTAKRMANIDATNFRTAAERAIKKYEKDGKLAEAIMWMRIVNEYEAALADHVRHRPLGAGSSHD